MTTSARRWKAFTSTLPTPVRLVNTWMSGSASTSRWIRRYTSPTLGIVERHRADERELDVGEPLAHQAVGLDHAERILPLVEPRDLGDQGPLRVDADPLQDPGGEARTELQVLRALGVDRGRDDLGAPDREVGRDEPTEREHRRVVANDERLEEAPDGRVGLGGVDVAAPDPPAWSGAVQLEQGERLRIVDHDEVVVLVERAWRFAPTARGTAPRRRPKSPTRRPWSPLWIVLVTRKNDSSPLMSCQSAASPRSRRSGISERRISATPPPYGVALTCSTRAPRSGAASSGTIAMASRPALAR